MPCNRVWLVILTRSPNTNNTNNAWNLNSNGSLNNNNCSNTNGVRPALVERPDRVGICRKPCHHTRKGAISCPIRANTLHRCPAADKSDRWAAKRLPPFTAGRHGALFVTCCKKGGGFNFYDLRGIIHFPVAI